MSGPRDFLKRAENVRRQNGKRSQLPPCPEPETPRPMQPVCPMPAVCPPMPPAKKAEEAPPPEAPEYRIAPRPIGGHGIYRDLMRSHDRMGTRHIPRGD